MRGSIVAAPVVTGLVFAAVPALAQNATPAPAAENSESADIIVTANKREERLVDVSQSITAVSADAYQALNPRQFQDIQKLVPNLSIVQGQGVQSTRYTIRGIGSVSTRAALQSAVAIFIDDVYQVSPVQSNVDLIDIARVEVLRGPQGTLFGRNAQAGAIRIVTQQPGQDFHANIEAQYGIDDYFTVKGGLSGPIASGVLYGGIAASHVEGGGYVYNPTTKSKAPTSRRDAGRLTMRLAPEGSRGSLTITGSYAKSFDITVIPTTTPYTYRQNGSTDQTVDSESYGASARGELDLGTATLTSISAFDYSKFVTAGDGDGAPQFFFTNSELRTQSTLSQEIRLASNGGGQFRWIVGGYYYYERYYRRAGEMLNLAAIAPPSITVPGLGTLTPTFFPSASLTISDTLRVQTNSYAIFGEASYRLGRFELTLGGRYTWDNQDGDINQPDNIGFRYGPLPPTLIDSQLQATRALRSKSFTPRGIISFKPNDDTNLYVSVSRGFKGGGFNTSLDPNSVQFLTVNPETVTNYEAGAKLLLGQKRFSLNLAGFYMKYDNQQVVQQVNSTLNLTATVNAAQSRIYGFEAEGSARIGQVLTLGGGVGYTNARFERYPNCVAATSTTPAVDCAGKTLPFTPEWTITGTANLHQPLSDTLALTGNATVRYTSSSYVQVENSAVSLLPAYTTVDAGLGLEFGKFSIGVWGRNISDAKNLTIYQNSPFFGAVYSPGPRRAYGVRAAARF